MQATAEDDRRHERQRSTSVDRLRVLQLRAEDYSPHKIITWQAAIVLLYTNKADVLEEYDAKISSPSVTIHVPAVIRLRKVIKREKKVKWSRDGVYARDKYTCCYCGKKFPRSRLEYDHVIPKSRWTGPKHEMTNWLNIVTACETCNRRKDNRTPQEAGMKMHYQPYVPTSLPAKPFLVDTEDIPSQWRAWLGQTLQSA